MAEEIEKMYVVRDRADLLVRAAFTQEHMAKTFIRQQRAAENYRIAYEVVKFERVG